MQKKLLILMMILWTIKPVNVYASELELVRATCYTGGTVCATGITPREGIVASNPDWYGDILCIYDKDMKFIGYYEVADTGGKPVKSGKILDVYRDNLDRCNEWTKQYGDYVYVMRVDAENDY